MKVVYMNDTVYGYATGNPLARGGAERYGWYLMRALAQASWSVTVGVRSALEEGEVQVIDGVRFLGLGRRGHLLFSWYRFLKNERPDWCFWQGATFLWGPAAEIARYFRVRTAFSIMHDREVQLRNALNLRKNLWPLYKWGLQRSDVIFSQHDSQREALPLCWQQKVYPLPGIVALSERIIPHVERGGTVVWVGVIKSPKRPDLLLEIARRLPTVRFVVCGAPGRRYNAKVIDPVLAELRALPNVDYRGHVAPEQALKVIGEGSLLLSTSDGEGFPSVFLEAWAAGTPVVSLQIDPDCKIQKHRLGKVTETVEGTVDAIRFLMTVPEHRQDMGVKAHRHVEEFHSPSAAARAFEVAVMGVRGGQATVMQGNQTGRAVR